MGVSIMKALAVVVAVVVAAFALKFVLAIAFTILHFLLLVGLVAALALGVFALYKYAVAKDDAESDSV
jgi:hypothetical protein